MTLREKIEEVLPEAIDAREEGGVKACPGDYEFLNDYASCFDSSSQLCGSTNCTECWNRLFIPADEATETEEVPAHPENTVDHPSHYNRFKHECIEEMIALFGIEAVKAFCKCNVYKYRYRAGAKGTSKDEEKDLQKSEWYMDKLMELESLTNNHVSTVLL